MVLNQQIKYYINGEERSEKAFFSFDLQNDCSRHFAILHPDNTLIEFGYIPELIIRFKKKD